MRQVITVLGYWGVLILGVGQIASCTTVSTRSDNDDDDDNRGGDGGHPQGGAGGSRNGGTGGGGTGGAGGSNNGGSGGDQGGSDGGGNGGMVSASVGQPFFSGKDQSISKLHAGDADAGYVYLTSMENSFSPTIIEVNDSALPSDIKYAYKIDVPTAQFSNVIFGFNFRQDSSPGTWNWFDASAYGGIRFRARYAGTAAAVNVLVYDSNNLAITEQPNSNCQSDVRQGCEPVNRRSLIVRDTWEEFVIPWDQFSSDGAVMGLGTSNLGRVDLLHLAFGAGGFEMWVTDITLISAEDAL